MKTLSTIFVTLFFVAVICAPVFFIDPVFIKFLYLALSFIFADQAAKVINNFVNYIVVNKVFEAKKETKSVLNSVYNDNYIYAISSLMAAAVITLPVFFIQDLYIKMLYLIFSFLFASNTTIFFYKVASSFIANRNLKKKDLFITAVAAIAAVNPEGFTINSKSMTPETAGYCVALAETQNSFNNEGLARVYDVVSSGRANAVGGWLDSESGLYYYDAVVVLQDRTKAIELGRLNKQLAIFDLNNMEEIRL